MAAALRRRSSMISSSDMAPETNPLVDLVQMRAFLALSLLAAACNQPKQPAPAAKTEADAITWIHDDYGQALSRAKAQGKPLFIDAWAPWCHTCLSMQSFVFTDPSMKPLADRFVWLALDTEKGANAPVVVKFPVTVWPTFFIIDP